MSLVLLSLSEKSSLYAEETEKTWSSSSKFGRPRPPAFVGAYRKEWMVRRGSLRCGLLSFLVASSMDLAQLMGGSMFWRMYVRRDWRSDAGHQASASP